MRRNDLEEALLTGRIDPQDAPADLAALAALIRAAQAPAAPFELAGTEELVAEVAALVRASRPVPQVAPARRLAPRLALRIAAAALGAALTGGIAAAATGALPASLQAPVARALHHLGISLPRPPAGTVPARRRTETSSHAPRRGAGRCEHERTASPARHHTPCATPTRRPTSATRVTSPSSTSVPATSAPPTSPPAPAPSSPQPTRAHGEGTPRHAPAGARHHSHPQRRGPSHGRQTSTSGSVQRTRPPRSTPTTSSSPVAGSSPPAGGHGRHQTGASPATATPGATGTTEPGATQVGPGASGDGEPAVNRPLR